MRRLRIVKYTFEGDYVDIEGIDIVALTPEEYEVLKDVLTAEGYGELPTS